MCFCLRVAIVFCVLCVVCRMRERQRDITRAAGEGGCLAPDGWGLYFHINHIGVGVAEQLLRGLCQSLMWAFSVVCDAVVSCKIMIESSSYHTAFIFAHACMTQQHC